METFDVVVIGGGPAGSVAAARLASHGRRVAVLERDRHPRFHLGESLLPASMGVLDAIGVLDDVGRRFIPKYGARFVDAEGTRTVRYAFAEAFGARWDHAFEVPRDAFDALLFRRAAALGADAREGWEARAVDFDGARAAGVRARGPDGVEASLKARFVVDASGREAMTARASGSIERITHLDRTALYTQYTGTWRDSGEREGDIQIVVFGQGAERGWFWVIPFAGVVTSVGAVVSSAWIRARQALGGPEALFDAAVGQAPSMAGMLQGAARVFAPRATADFSFRVGAMRGPGWLSIGDAGGFIDPLFSTGAHLGMCGALAAADAIDEALRDGDEGRPERFERWEQRVRAGARLFVGAVQSFYAGDLVNYLFAEPQHPFLRRAITSMLAGEVFDEGARWVREMKTRFPEQRDAVEG